MVEGPFYVTFMVARNVPRRLPTPDHENWTLDDLKDGFWVTEQHVPCRPAQGAMWIPPSQITLIEKRNKAPDPL